MMGMFRLSAAKNAFSLCSAVGRSSYAQQKKFISYISGIIQFCFWISLWFYFS